MLYQNGQLKPMNGKPVATPVVDGILLQLGVDAPVVAVLAHVDHEPVLQPVGAGRREVEDDDVLLLARERRGLEDLVDVVVVDLLDSTLMPVSAVKSAAFFLNWSPVALPVGPRRQDGEGACVLRPWLRAGPATVAVPVRLPPAATCASCHRGHSSSAAGDRGATPFAG